MDKEKLLQNLTIVYELSQLDGSGGGLESWLESSVKLAEDAEEAAMKEAMNGTQLELGKLVMQYDGEVMLWYSVPVLLDYVETGVQVIIDRYGWFDILYGDLDKNVFLDAGVDFNKSLIKKLVDETDPTDFLTESQADDDIKNLFPEDFFNNKVA